MTEPRPLTNVVAIVVDDATPPDEVPDWIIPGALYRRREVLDWAAEHHGFDFVAQDAAPVSVDPLPVLELRGWLPSEDSGERLGR